ncbi:DNA double-strand break repair nuclease NurA [Acetivibrio clariflavus]|uniref:DNA double-strand break repair nuclease NurA n=1 Tax=Acetivibrio clariflavus TaxID=288965 RepID=UPI0031F4B582
MPYKYEYADKTSHFDIVNNPEIAKFIQECDFMTEPSGDEGERMNELFVNIPQSDEVLPEKIIAIDGSYYEASVQNRIPSTKVGYVKIGSLLIDRGQYRNLRVLNNRFVDPFRVAKVQENNSPITFPFPSSNIVLKGKKNVRDSFRYAMDKHLYEHRTIKNKPDSSLRTTLFYLASLRTGELGTDDPKKLKIHKCPSCEKKEIELYDIPEEQYCPSCKSPVYPSDCLRIWEEVTDYQSNSVALSRFMNVIEHIIPIHYIRIVREYYSESFANILSNLAFFIDGPLAVFGNPAWIHASILRYLNKINYDMKRYGKGSILLIGLQKSGHVAEYFKLIDNYINNNKIFAITDNYRYTYITPNNEPSSNGFGYETYYGQDFLLKTESGRIFVFALPYPFASKTEKNFIYEKTKYSNYDCLSKAVQLIKDFECDLYENAVVPVALAHKYTAISLEPGTKVLDLLSQTSIKGLTSEV